LEDLTDLAKKKIRIGGFGEKFTDRRIWRKKRHGSAALHTPYSTPSLSCLSVTAKAKPSLRSKRSRTKPTKFGPREARRSFSLKSETKTVERKGLGRGKMERLHANPLILKNLFAHERGS